MNAVYRILQTPRKKHNAPDFNLLLVHKIYILPMLILHLSHKIQGIGYFYIGDSVGDGQWISQASFFLKKKKKKIYWTTIHQIVAILRVLPVHFPEEKITITSGDLPHFCLPCTEAGECYVMANTVIPHSSREHRKRQKESRCASLTPSGSSSIPPSPGARRRCIFRREARWKLRDVDTRSWILNAGMAVVGRTRPVR